MNIEKYDWIQNPFSTTITSSYEITLVEEEEFWISVQTKFKTISEKSIKIVLQFSTSYLCELGFATLTNIKTKKQERLTNIEEEMRVAIFYIRPDTENISKLSDSKNISYKVFYLKFLNLYNFLYFLIYYKF